MLLSCVLQRMEGQQQQPVPETAQRFGALERLACFIDLGVPGKEDEHRAGRAHEWIDLGQQRQQLLRNSLDEQVL